MPRQYWLMKSEPDAFSLDDLKKLKSLEKKNLIGVISGKAIYENKFSVNKAVEILES